MKTKHLAFSNHPAMTLLKKNYNFNGGYYDDPCQIWVHNKYAEGFLYLTQKGLFLAVDVKGCFDKIGKCPFIVNLDNDFISKLRAIRKCYTLSDAFDWSNEYNYITDTRGSFQERAYDYD